MVHPTDEAVHLLNESTLLTNPFPEAVTGRNSTFLARVTEWAEAARQGVMCDVERLRGKPPGEEPEAWELAALRRAVGEWRIFETFRRLHEERWCPGLLFRLHTKTDLLILCDPDADSSKAGFGKRQRRLAKRGIAGRLEWVEARRLVAALGLLGDAEAVPSVEDGSPEKAEQGKSREVAPASDVAGDGAAGAAEAAAVAAAPVERVADDEAPAVEAAPETETEIRAGRPEPGRDEVLPPLHLNRVWSALPTYTKAQLEAVYERFGIGLWSQFGDRFYSSMRKAEMLTYAKRVVRHHACLDAAERLSERQLDALHDWMRMSLAGQYQRDGDRSDPDLRIAARLFADFQAGAALSRDGHGLSPEAWNRYRDGELRRIAAFCYHRFYEAETAAAHTGKAA